MPDAARRPARAATVAVVALLLVACEAVVPTASPTPIVTLSPTATPTATVPSATPTATPEPAHTIDLPAETDPRRVRVAVVPALEGAGGRITVTVTNLADTRIEEIVLRWSTDLADELFLAPFVPSAERVEEFGPPLTDSTDWTKWVEGPGEDGEPAGTTSLGYGPVDAGMTLSIPLFVTRRAQGPVAFDLQLLAGESLLTLEDGEPAGLRVETP